MSSSRLFDAIRAGDLQTTRKLLEGKEGIDVDKLRGECERTPLHKACAHLSGQIVKFLIHEKKVEVNTLDEDGWTPLYETCRSSYNDAATATAIAELLLTNGANVNTKTTSKPSGDTALHTVCVNAGCTQLIQMLLDNGAGENINVVNGEGETPLHIACKFGHISRRTDVIKLLLANNADRSIKKSSGKGPADLLQDQGMAEVFESYDKWSLAISGVTHQPMMCREYGQSGVMVNLNPKLNRHQHSLALKTLLLVRRLPVHEVALEILGFLTPAAVERIFLST